MKKVGLVTFRRDRYGKVVDPNIPYCTYTEDEAKKIMVEIRPYYYRKKEEQN